MKSLDGSERLRASDLRMRAVCKHCGKPHTAHMVPYGEPTLLLITGWCEHCQRTMISFDAMGGDVRPAAGQLAEFFGQVAGIGGMGH